MVVHLVTLETPSVQGLEDQLTQPLDVQVMFPITGPVTVGTLTHGTLVMLELAVVPHTIQAFVLAQL